MTALILSLLALILLIGVWFWRRQPQLARRPLRSSPLTSARPAGAQRPRWFEGRGNRNVVLAALLGVVALWLLLTQLGLFQPRATVAPGEFVVRIAPFVSTGTEQRQGGIVAEQLLAALQQDLTTPMNVGVLNAPVTSVEQASEIAQAGNVDVIIWGQVAEGATAAQPGLEPQLLWRPGLPFEPRTWQGFDGHFVLPADYSLALQPLNGPAVLIPLLDAINHFSRGDADKAAALCDDLRRNYGDVLRPELPAMLQAMIYWAEGRQPEAESAAQIALEANSRPEHWNNLGAIRLDQRKLEPAREALLQALTDAPNLAQAHANLGRLLMNQGQPAGALPDLRSAVALLPNSTAVIATLGEAYRRSGHLGDARTAVQAVLALDSDNGPALAEQGMLALTPAITATKRLEWELEQPPTRTPEQLAEIRGRTETGITAIEALRNEYLRKANAYGVSGRPDMQRLAETQAVILEQETLNRRYQLMLVQIEQGRVLSQQPRSRLRRIWDTLSRRRTPLQEAIVTATSALQQEPGQDLQYDYLYQQGRAAYLSQNPQLARSRWEAALQLAADAPEDSPLRRRPEAHYGLARLLLDENKSDDARNELTAALQADDQFFPARQELARQAEAGQQWAEAAEQYRWLATNRPWTSEDALALARMLRQQNNLSEAEAQLLPLANQGDVGALVQLAALYRQSGKLDQAQQVLERAQTIDPTSADVYEEQAALALAQNNVPRAVASLQQALQLDPQRSSAHITLGQLYANQLGQPAAAAAEFQAAAADDSADPLIHRQLGETLLRAGNPQAATESFRKAIALDENSHEAYHGLAMAYLAQQRYDLATQAEQRALDLAQGNYTLAIVGMGDIERAQGRYDEAITRYRDAIERDPALTAAYLGLGRAAADQGQFDIAINHYQRGLEGAPDDVALLLALGDAQLQQNDVVGALESYGRAKELQPNNAAAHVGLGRALWRQNQSDAALAELSRATQLNPSDTETLLMIGDLNESLGRADVALQAYTAAIAANDRSYEAYYRRGVLLLKQESAAQAIEDLEAAVQRNGSFAQAHYWLGRAYRADGRFDDARQQLQQAIALRGDYFEARFFLGRVLAELGQRDEAAATYSAIIAEAASNDPWRAEAQRELDRIR